VILLLLIGAAFTCVLVMMWRAFPKTCTWLAVFFLGAVTGESLVQYSQPLADVFGWAWLAAIVGLPVWWAFRLARKHLRGEA